MNIALIHYAAPPVVGGVETVLARQAQLFSRAGHQVQILCGRGQIWDVNIPVVVNPRFDSRFPAILKLKASLDEGMVPDNFSEMVDLIQSDLQRCLEGVEVLIAHNVASLHKNLALTAALYNISQSRKAPRMILWHHDLAWTTPRYAEELYFDWPWNLLRLPWKGVKQVTISKARQTELTELYGITAEEISIIPAGLDTVDFYGLHPRTLALLEKLDLSDKSPIFLTPVRITTRKNLELGIKMLASIHQKFPQAVLIITGPPGAHNPNNKKYLKKLQRLRDKLELGKRVLLLAEYMPEGLPDEMIPDFYRIADVLFMPSREEGFGIPILEAGLSRLPIFCSDIPQLRALAGDSAVYFSPDENPDYIAGLISQYLQRDRVYQWRVKVRQEYTWEAIYKKQLEPLLY